MRVINSFILEVGKMKAVSVAMCLVVMCVMAGSGSAGTAVVVPDMLIKYDGTWNAGVWPWYVLGPDEIALGRTWQNGLPFELWGLEPAYLLADGVLSVDGTGNWWEMAGYYQSSFDASSGPDWSAIDTSFVMETVFQSVVGADGYATRELGCVLSAHSSFGYRQVGSNLAGSEVFHLYVGDVNGGWPEVPAPVPGIDAFHHYGLVYTYIDADTATTELYIDGAVAASITSAPAYEWNDTGFWYGNESWWNYNYRPALGNYDAIALASFTGTFDPATDFQLLTDPNYATNVSPRNGATLVSVDADIEWGVPAGFTSTVVFGADPNVGDNPEVVSADSVTSHDPGTLDYSTTYYWRVTTHEPNDVGYIDRVGGVWAFTTEGAEPVIASFDNVLTSLDLLDADLAAVVSDADNNIASVSWEVLRDDIAYPAGAVAEVTPDEPVDLYAPTATFSTDTAGTYFVKVTATDADGAPANAIAEVRVLETACAAAQASGNWAGFDPLDSDTDCDIDMVDLAAFAAKWLSDIGLDGQEVWTGEVSYMPTPYGIPNGGFENGSLDGWKSETWASGEITDVPGDVQEGTYACGLLKSNDGVTTGVLDLPVGSHSITLWYKGDIPTFVCGFDDATTATYNITSHVFDGVDYVLVTGAVPAYTQFTVEFDVTVAGTGHFYAWGNGEGGGTGFVDDFRLNLNVN